MVQSPFNRNKPKNYSSESDRPVASRVGGGTISKGEADEINRISRSRSSSRSSKNKSSNSSKSQQSKIKDSVSYVELAQKAIKEQQTTQNYTPVKQQKLKAIRSDKKSVSTTAKVKTIRGRASFDKPASEFSVRVGVRQDDRDLYGVYDIQNQRSQPFRSFQEEQKLKSAFSRPRKRESFADPVASDVTGGTITRGQASSIQKEAERKRKKVTPLDRGFYTLEGQKQAFGRVGQEFEFLGKRTANIFLPKSREFQVGKPKSENVAERFVSNPVTVFLAPAAVSSVALSVPVAGSAVKFGAVGTGVGITSALGLQKGGEIIREEEYQFAQQNPVIFEEARRYARQQTGAQTDPISRFFGLNVARGGGSTFVESGSEFLESRGVRGEQLRSAQRSLAAQAQNEQIQEVATLLTAELAGEAAGAGLIRTGARAAKRAASRSADRITLEALEIPIAGGASEGASATASQSFIENRRIDAGSVFLGAALGSATAGTFELVRRAPSTTKMGSALTTTVGNIIEPQEFIADTALSGFERGINVVRRRRTRRDLLPRDTDFVEVSPNVYRARKGTGRTVTLADTFTGSQSLSPVRTKAATPAQTNTEVESLLGTPSRQPSKQQEDSLSIIRSTTETKTTTKVRSFFPSFTKSFTKTQANVFTSVLSTTETLSKTRTRTFTPEIPFIPLLGGSATGRRGKGGKKRQRRALTKSLAGQVFGTFYKERGLRTTRIGAISGLGVRL